MSWRLLQDSGVSHHRGLALDDAVTRLTAGVNTPTLRLYTYSPCVLVGRFQQVDAEVRLDNCRALKVPVNRRPSGGGTIIMGPDQLGIALSLPKSVHGFASRSSELMKQCAGGLVNTLRTLGIHATFMGKNDLVVHSKKIAGLGLYQPNTGGRLFHASLLFDLDIDNMLKLLQTPFKSSDHRARSRVAQRITTVRSEIDAVRSMAELIDVVMRGYEDEFGITFELGSLTSDESKLADELTATQYSTDEWVYQSGAPIHDWVGQCTLRTDAGDLDIKVIVIGEIIKSVFLGGNFVVPEKAIYDLESSLRWHVRDPIALRRTVLRSVQRNADAWDRISSNQVVSVILNALQQIAPQSSKLSAGACFAR